MKFYSILFLALFAITHMTKAQEDKYLWLEEVDGEKALEFVKSQSDATLEKLKAEPDYQAIYDKSLEIMNSTDRIAYPRVRGEYVYNFWKDKDHARGIWRRATLESYRSGEPEWDILLDIDALSEKDNVKWVYKGASGLYPDYNRFLIDLSKGGGDAVITREFDVDSKSFIEDGFFIDESKGNASYLDENTLIVSSDFGEGTMTNSGYPKQVKFWERGTALSEAKLIHEGADTDAFMTTGFVLRDGEKAYTLIVRYLTTFSSKRMVWQNDELIELDIPNDSRISAILKDQLMILLRSDWEVDGTMYKSGTLISLDFSDLLKGQKTIQVVVAPDEYSSISDVQSTKNKLLVGVLRNVTDHLYIYSYEDGKWQNEKVKAPDFGSISVVGTDDLSDKYFFDFQNFITPSTLYSADAADNTFQAYKSLPAFFDASKYEIKQFKAKSSDGTMIPYFMVASKGLELNGKNPTLVYAYGGFEVSLSPFYASVYGTSWMERGGVFVLANIRGGGEFGPDWHLQGIKENRQKVFDDFYAVAEDLIERKVTSSENLGAMGGSNGGLLVGVAFTQRPDLYNAIVCQVPLLDMKRYNKLLAGASWMGEYGNPDIPEEWEYIRKYSPYHNLKEGVDYPEVYFGTSTRDDRVHPGHARKMVAKMNDMGYSTYYFENTEGGHAGSSTNEQRARSYALTFSYLLKKLK